MVKFAQTNSAVQDFMARFVQCAPLQSTTKSHGRALGLVKASSTFAADLKLHLRKCAKTNANAASAEAQISMATSTYWNMPGMQITYMERSLCGCIRYQMHGESELLLLPVGALLDAWSDVDMSRAVYERVKQLNEADVEELFKGKGAVRVVLSASTVLVVPPATMLAEKSLNGGASYGFRLPFMYGDHREQWRRAYMSVKQTYADHPHMPQMTAIDKAFSQM